MFGPQLAEVPLVATRHSARRQGHARVLMRAIEARPARARMRCDPQHCQLTHDRSGCCAGRMHTTTEIPFLFSSETQKSSSGTPTGLLTRGAQGLLAGVGVQTLGLPAAATTIGTWMHGFGFVAMPEEQQRAARSELRILVFPGAGMLVCCAGRLSLLLPCSYPIFLLSADFKVPQVCHSFAASETKASYDA